MQEAQIQITQIQTVMENPMAQMPTLTTLMMENTPIQTAMESQTHMTQIIRNLKQVQVMEAQKAEENPMLEAKDKAKHEARGKSLPLSPFPFPFPSSPLFPHEARGGRLAASPKG